MAVATEQREMILDAAFEEIEFRGELDDDGKLALEGLLSDQQAMDEIPVGIYVMEIDGTVIKCNAGAIQAWGRTPELGTTDCDRPFQQLMTEAAWGSVWSRPGWSKRERSIVTLALLAALGHDEEVALHVRATANTGASREDICEAFLHVAIYAGVPAANRAIKVAKEVFAEMDAQSSNGR